MCLWAWHILAQVKSLHKSCARKACATLRIRPQHHPTHRSSSHKNNVLSFLIVAVCIQMPHTDAPFEYLASYNNDEKPGSIFFVVEGLLLVAPKNEERRR